jgi:hypothetical protein
MLNKDENETKNERSCGDLGAICALWAQAVRGVESSRSDGRATRVVVVDAKH